MKSLLETDYQTEYDAWKQTPSPTTSGALLRKVDPVINSAMRTYGGQSAKSPTLRTRARQIALQSFQTYDPQRGPMKSHLMSHMQGLRRYSRQEQNIIPIPEQVAMHLHQTAMAGQELEDRLGRPASDQELSDFTGLSLKRLEHIRRAKRPVAEGTLMQQVGDRGMYMPEIKQLDDDSVAWAELVYSDLNDTDRFILERSLGMHGHQQLAPGQIAAFLKLSPGAISQRMQRIQTKLDQREELRMI
jgi:DNA-directed RNA polymerase specialized sigma subunit